jgi:hypothetical protein
MRRPSRRRRSDSMRSLIPPSRSWVTAWVVSRALRRRHCYRRGRCRSLERDARSACVGRKQISGRPPLTPPFHSHQILPNLQCVSEIGSRSQLKSFHPHLPQVSLTPETQSGGVIGTKQTSRRATSGNCRWPNVEPCLWRYRCGHTSVCGQGRHPDSEWPPQYRDAHSLVALRSTPHRSRHT